MEVYWMHTTVAFTGHRPNKLRGGYDWMHPENLKLGRVLRGILIELIEQRSVDTFITGGALGIDQMSFMIVNKLKQRYPYLRNILAVPFENQAGNWISSSVQTYENIKMLADEVVYVDELAEYQLKDEPTKIYLPPKMQKRNEYMVDNADIVIAVWDGTGGGTKNCVDYARKKNKELIQINPNKI